MFCRDDKGDKQGLVQKDGRYGAHGLWARVFWLFPIGPGIGAAVGGLVLIQNGIPSTESIDAFLVLSVAELGLVWMCIGCLWITMEGHRTIQRLEVDTDRTRVEPFFGSPFEVKNDRVQQVAAYTVPLYKRPWTLLDRRQENWLVTLEDGRVLLLNGSYFNPSECWVQFPHDRRGVDRLIGVGLISYYSPHSLTTRLPSDRVRPSLGSLVE